MSKPINLLILLTILTGLMVIPVLPASAATFTVVSSSASGPIFPATVGSTITLGGSGAVPGAGKSIKVYLARSPGAKSWAIPDNDGDIVAITRSSSAGGWGASFVVSERRSSSPSGGPVANGVYDVFLMSGADTYTFTGLTGLNIKPDIRCSPASASPGTPVTLQGIGFTGSETGITAIFDTTGINTTVFTGITASANGSWTATFKVPDRSASSGLIISATGTNTTGTGTPTTTFEVTRGLLPVPDKAGPGATVTTSCRGFAASSAMTFKLDTTTLTTTPASPSTTADGRVIASFVIPPGTSYGLHIISATDALGNLATEPLTVTRLTSITLNPASGIPGDTITISGSGFNPSALLTFTLNGSSLSTNPGEVTTLADGSFSATAIITESWAPGYYSLIVTDVNGESAGSIYSMLQPVALASYNSEVILTHGHTSGATGGAYLGGQISRFISSSTGETVSLPDGIGSFDTTISYSAAGVAVKSVTADSVWPLVVNLNTTGGTVTTVTSSQMGATLNPPVELFRIFPSLIGSKDNVYTITFHFNSLTTVSGTSVPQQADVTKTFIRGDANNNGSVNITDALFIAQYLAGLRGLGETTALVNPINSATPRNDSATASLINITDALIIAQMLAGLRDSSYNFVTYSI